MMNWLSKSFVDEIVRVMSSKKNIAVHDVQDIRDIADNLCGDGYRVPDVFNTYMYKAVCALHNSEERSLYLSCYLFEKKFISFARSSKDEPFINYEELKGYAERYKVRTFNY